MTGKKGLNSMTKAYFKVPIQVIDVGLTTSAFAVYMYMASCAEDFEPSIRIMSKKLRLNKNTVSRSVKELLDKKLIELMDQGELGKRSRYRFLNPTKWIYGNMA